MHRPSLRHPLVGSAMALAAALSPLPARPGGAPPIPIEPEDGLTLRQALDLTAGHNPDLAAASLGVLAAEGEARQTGAWPNPELALEIEPVGGAGPRRGLDGPEATVRLTQAFGLGGPRCRRRAAAAAETRLAQRDRETARREARRAATRAFVDVLAAQERLTLADAARALAIAVRRAAVERVKAGKVPDIEVTKAGVEIASADIALGQARRDLDAARARLAACWGSRAPRFRAAVGSLTNVPDLGPLDAHAAVLEQAPDVARWDDALAVRREALALAQAARVPDLALNAGVRRFEDDDTYAAVAGLALPLPVFDRRAGGIAAARHRARAAEHGQRAARARAAADLAEVHARLETARTTALAIRDTLLPAAQTAFEAAETGYRQGKFGFLDVLDAQRTLQAARAGHLDAVANYHRAAADLERLTGIATDTMGSSAGGTP